MRQLCALAPSLPTHQESEQPAGHDPTSHSTESTERATLVHARTTENRTNSRGDNAVASRKGRDGVAHSTTAHSHIYTCLLSKRGSSGPRYPKPQGPQAYACIMYTSQNQILLQLSSIETYCTVCSTLHRRIVTCIRQSDGLSRHTLREWNVNYFGVTSFPVVDALILAVSTSCHVPCSMDGGRARRQNGSFSGRRVASCLHRVRCSL